MNTKEGYTKKDYKNLLIPIMVIYQIAYEWYGKSDRDSMAKTEDRLMRGELPKSAKVKKND